MKAVNKKSPEEIYLEYVNDWITVEAMAEHYGRSEQWMYRKIHEGRDARIKSLLFHSCDD